ncbi:Histidine kinase [Dyadobacter koreensis]|uniref:Histidine kinase n=2 Tax=Dyadobacter koreensis TaxID=408657 RepID=A0A1H7AJW7_9BACT|nr:Histidine kinase [Dyadobacter koreensis]
MLKMAPLRSFAFTKKFFFRIILHALLIIFTWIIGKYLAVGPLTKDNSFVTNALCILFFAQTIAIYYFLSAFVFPRFLYKKKIIPFLFWLLVSFLIIYWTNYASIIELYPYSNKFDLVNKTQETWVKNVYGYINNNGWFGCFTDQKIAFWNYSFSFGIVTFYLCVKAFADILFIQTKNLILERDNLALELDFLKSQINPHFLFNTLNSIYTRTVDIDEQASDLVLKLSDLMRYSLYGVNEEKVPLTEELEYIRNYLELEKYRHPNNLVDISFAMDGEASGLKIAPLLLISFVENAFKHGVNLSRKSSYVYVSAVIEEDVLYFTVQNSLPDRVKSFTVGAAVKKSGGIGLVNTRKRLNLLYSDRHDLNVRHTDDEYEVMIGIRLDKA